MARNSKITDKDMSVLREADKAGVQKEARRGSVRDYSLKHRVTVNWDLNEESMKDQMFRLTVDDYEVILDSEELLRLLRWV